MTSKILYFDDLHSSTALPPTKHQIYGIWDFILNEQIRPRANTETFFWYRGMEQPIIAIMGDLYVEDITSADIQRGLNGLRINPVTKKPYSDKTIKERAVIVRRIMNYALEEQYIYRNPFNSNVRRPKGTYENPLDTVLDKDSLQSFLVGVNAHPVFRTIVLSILLTGVRINELLGLEEASQNRTRNTISITHQAGNEFDDVSGLYINKRLSITQTKTPAGKREIPVDPKFFCVIDEWYRYMGDSIYFKCYEKGRCSGLVFPNRYGNIRSDQGLRKQYKRFLLERNLPYVTFHALRRTFASHMEEAGVRLEVIAALLGHELEGYETTRKHYALVGSESKRGAVTLYMKYMKNIFEPYL